MAGTLALVSASPSTLKYTFTSGGASPQAASRTALQMLADALTATQGPSQIAQLLSAYGLAGSDDAAWAALPRGGKLDVSACNEVSTVASTMGIVFSGAGVAEAMVCTEIGATNNDVWLIEVKFVQANDR